ncbi:MipA/OmpV family protein [Roseomonas sp. OT10]|uniref:MipA/OmpV family protein n=1 Tax=Roseomonas cutis TaxID=2897332 RepID=UPI001E57F1DE|nr:MipA/OmpV family protein [Roseomonas sp. OT10]UFN48244.1 MipA/OmpV family protein [Roseomonas sp. OT10]
MSRPCRTAPALGLLALLAAGPVAAQEVRLPVFEAGIGGAAAWVPDYPAAGQNHLQAIPVPYVIYRGQILRSDDQGVRGRVYSSDSIGLDLSFSGAFPSSSSDNRAREGMPDLDWQGEVGPALRLTLWRDPGAARRINLELPVRAVFSTDLSSIHFRGVVFSPELAFEQRGLRFAGDRLRAGIGPIVATERLMDYFYEVEPRYVRPGRPAYDAEGGYLGTRLQFSYRVPLNPRVSVYGGGRVESFHGAANRDSPLFRDNWNVSAAIGIAWSFYQSEATVASAADPFD